MNMEKIHWVDLDKPKTQEMHFKDLNSESSTVKFKNLDIDGSKDADETASDPSTLVLASSVYDLVKKYYPKTMVVEKRTATPTSPSDEQDDVEDDNNSWKTTWAEFEEHAKVILTFLNASQKKQDETLKKLRQMFQELGEGDESKGFKLFNRLDNYIRDCGGERTQPKLSAKLLLTSWSADEIKSLFNLFTSVQKSKNGSLLSALQKVQATDFKTTTLRKLITMSYGDGEIEIDENILTKLTRFTGVKKRTAIGQGEILFAILFKDCELGLVGDIDCISGGKIIPIEMKSNSAGPDDIGRIPVPKMMAACGYE